MSNSTACAFSSSRPARRSTRQKRALVTAKSALRALLGRTEPDQSFDVLGTLDVPTNIPFLEIHDLMRLAEENRPDILALKYKLQQAKANIKTQEAQAYPQLAITGGYSFQEQQPIGMRNTSEWSASVQTSIPIFDHNRGNIRKARAAALQAIGELSGRRDPGEHRHRAGPGCV